MMTGSKKKLTGNSSSSANNSFITSICEAADPYIVISNKAQNFCLTFGGVYTGTMQGNIGKGKLLIVHVT